MKYLETIFIFLIILLNSCINEVHENNRVKISYNWSNIDIETKENALALSDNPNIILKNNQEFYVNYNQVTHSLNFYNLENKCFEKKIDFYKSGPDKIQMLSIYNLIGDTIVSRGTETIQLFNSSGKLIKELQMTNICPKLDENYSFRGSGGIVITNLQSLFIDQNTNNIFLRTFNKTDGYNDIYKEPKFCIYNLKTRVGKAIDVEFPDELYKKYYGDLEYPNIISKGDSVIYNFPFKASVYIYSIKNNKIEKNDFKAEHSPPVIKGASLSQKNNMMLKRTFFLGEKYYNIEYDHYNDLFYMLYSEKKIEDVPLKKYLIVFNNKLQKLGEIEIKSELSSEFVISKMGLLFRNIKDDSFDYLKLSVLKISSK